jgi:hypothetical protein
MIVMTKSLRLRKFTQEIWSKSAVIWTYQHGHFKKLKNLQIYKQQYPDENKLYKQLLTNFSNCFSESFKFEL